MYVKNMKVSGISLKNKNKLSQLSVVNFFVATYLFLAFSGFWSSFCFSIYEETITSSCRFSIYVSTMVALACYLWYSTNILYSRVRNKNVFLFTLIKTSLTHYLLIFLKDFGQTVCVAVCNHILIILWILHPPPLCFMNGWSLEMWFLKCNLN